MGGSRNSKETRVAAGLSKGERVRDEMSWARAPDIQQSLTDKVRRMQLIPNAVGSAGG